MQTRPAGVLRQFTRFKPQWRSPALALVMVAGVALPGAISSSPGPTAIFVSPSGSDANPGTSSLPVQTLQRAASLARQAEDGTGGTVTVLLAGGTYRLARPLALGPADSGAKGGRIVWTALPNQVAVISGAAPITGWRRQNASRNVWVAQVPASLDTRQIYVDGVRAQVASGRVPVTLRQTSYGFVASSPTLSHWRNPNQIEFVWVGQMGAWATQMCPIARVRGRTIRMAQPCWTNTLRHSTNLVTSCCLGNPTFVEDAPELLTQPGQFYLDLKQHELYYIPRPGQDMLDADVEAPVLQSLIQAHGTSRHPIENVEFSNLEFAYATWLQPGSRTGFSEIQAGYTLTGAHGAREGLCQLATHGTCPYGSWTPEPASVSLSYDRNVAFVDDEFVHLGAAALALVDGSQQDTVTGSVFTDISGNGIELGGVDLPTARGGSQTRSDRLVDNHLFGFPTEFQSGIPILVGYAAHCLISHNQIDHVSYSAISVGWGGWLDKIGNPSVPNFSRDNVISENLIFDYLGTLSDGGAIYTLGLTGSSLANGERVEGNVIHDQLDWGRAMQSDDGATYLTYSHNVVYNTPYSWDCTHLPQCHLQRVTNNYWQQTYPQRTQGPVIASANTVIADSEDAPASIVKSAGLDPGSESILDWSDGTDTPPGPPTGTYVFDASKGEAYVTWQPPVAAGSSPVLSYTVQACSRRHAQCASAASSVTVTAQEFDAAGYVIVPGLKSGTTYRFMVSATNSYGSGSRSLPWTAAVGRSNGGVPGRVHGIHHQTGPSSVALAWDPPKRTGAHPVVAYSVTCSNQQIQTVMGAGQLLPLNSGSRLGTVFGNLTPGTRYTFTIVADGAHGHGPAVTIGPFVPNA